MPETDRQESCFRQPLNAADRLMLVAHDGLRALGHAGFQCQTHLQLDGRIEPNRLRAALERLMRRYPVVGSRLEPRNDSSGPAWITHVPAELEFREHRLSGAGPIALLDWTARTGEIPLDLNHSSPIAFHLLHAEEGGDVFVIRFSHALMDGKSPELVLREIDRAYAGSLPDGPLVEADEDVAAYLGRFPPAQRRKAAGRVIGSHIGLPRRAVRLSRKDAPKWVVGPLQVKLRTLGCDETLQIAKRAKRLSGFPNLCATILAGVFRGLAYHDPARKIRPGAVLQTDVPINLRPPGVDKPIFHNFMTFVRVRMRAKDLELRDAAVQAITGQIRQQLRRQIDLGNLHLMHAMSRFDRFLQFHIRTTLQRSPFSLGFGFQGPAVAGLEQFCGVKASNMYSLNAALHPPGMSFQVNQFAGQTNLVLSHVADAISDSSANHFLDWVVGDLLA